VDDAWIGREQAKGLHAALEAAGVNLGQLWRHYFRIGGDVGAMEVEAYLHQALLLPALQRDLLAHACNELADGHHPHRAPYASDYPGPADGGPGDTSDDGQYGSVKEGSVEEGGEQAPGKQDDPADPDA
jgi:hypothetical protein